MTSWRTELRISEDASGKSTAGKLPKRIKRSALGMRLISKHVGNDMGDLPDVCVSPSLNKLSAPRSFPDAFL